MTETIEMLPWKIVDQEFACEHERSQLTRFIKSNGVVCVRLQCTRCGTSVKEVAKKGYDVDGLPLFDHSLGNKWWEKRKARSEELNQERNEQITRERAQENVQWWQKYNQYLRSQQWHDIRKLVLERDSHICQACLRNKASQAHHLSYLLYEQIGRSAAFELVAICRTCHHAIHPHMADAQENLALYNPYLNGGHNGHR